MQTRAALDRNATHSGTGAANIGQTPCRTRIDHGPASANSLCFERLPQLCRMVLEIVTTVLPRAQALRTVELSPFSSDFDLQRVFDDACTGW